MVLYSVERECLVNFLQRQDVDIRMKTWCRSFQKRRSADICLFQDRLGPSSDV